MKPRRRSSIRGAGRQRRGSFGRLLPIRGHGGTGPPVVLFRYAPGRSGEHAEQFLKGFRGRFLQCDGYEGYNRLTRIERPQGPWVLVHCWSHLRRRFVKLVRSTKSPIAEAAVRQIATLYAVEAMVRGASPEVRLAARQEHSAPIIAALKPWFEKQLSMISSSSKLAEHIRYGLAHWEGLTRFLDDGRLELDTNTVENAIRPIGLTRKNALFAGHEIGADNWAQLSSIVATCRLNDINPVAYLAETSRPSSTAIPKAKSKTSCPGDSERRQAGAHRGLAWRLLRARGRDLFSPSICRLRRARWQRRTDRGRVRARLFGGRTTRRGSVAT